MASEAPPAYESTIMDKDAPPSYDSVFGGMKHQMKDAQQDSSNKGTFLVRLCEILCGSIACLICLIVIAALPVAMIVIGAVYFHQCPLERRIPIWLIVFGCVSLAQTVVNIIKRVLKQLTKKHSGDEERQERNPVERGGSLLETLFSLFLFIWIIVGSVWIFGNWSEYQSYRENPSMYPAFECHPVVYLFSFVTLIIIYVVSWLLCICCCALFCIVALVAGARDS